MSQVHCHQSGRRQLVRSHQEWNGLDYLEVSEDQLSLQVFFLGKAPATITAANVLVRGGSRVTDIQVTGIEVERHSDPEVDDIMLVFVDKYGDFSTYQLMLVALDPDTGKPLYDEDTHLPVPMLGFDPRYSSLDFSFKASCPSDLDCAAPAGCTEAEAKLPDINYLAKDYGSFRQLILDRMALTMPNWKERHVPDLGITLVELLAYAGDHLSYYQDAVATEAYLDTARRRVSVRRHTRLVDYQLHEGCNARALVSVEVDADYPGLTARQMYFITRVDNAMPALNSEQLPTPLNQLVFEPLGYAPEQTIPFYLAHNSIQIYTWGDSQCCLPKGATSAVLRDPGTASPPDPEPDNSCTVDKSYPGNNDETPPPRRTGPKETDYQLHLEACDLLIFEETKGPHTGHPGDANPRHRQAVRLTRVRRTQDALTKTLLWEIEWAAEDALTFPLCISAIHREDCSPIEDVSVARGNLVLVDHGKTFDEPLPPAPGTRIPPDCRDHCLPPLARVVPATYRPGLGHSNLSFSQPLPACETRHCCHTHITPAGQLFKQDPRLALPAIGLLDQTNNTWKPQLDLLACDSDDRRFVVEVEEDRRAYLRFGNGDCGYQPLPGDTFTASYRIGNGNQGNVGAEAISHLMFRQTVSGVGVVRVRNPLPACGGVDPEPLAEARLYAPQAFKKVLKRAITPADYVAIVERDFGQQVQRAAARLRWTGSWYEMLVAIDPLANQSPESAAQLVREITCHLGRYRRIGHDLVVKPAEYVPIELEMDICVLPDYLQGQVKVALQDALSNRNLGNGKRGFFHPDNLSFGDAVHLSKLVACAQAVTGVAALRVKRLERQFEGANGEIEAGILPLGAFEIAVLNQNPAFPGQGKLTLNMRGGR